MVKRYEMVSAFLPPVLLAAVVGLLHRRAAYSPWSDDVNLALEPAWFQMAAPLWHSPLPDMWSLVSRVVSVFDPLSAASMQGDTRALAALTTAVAAVGLLIVLRRVAVPLLLALPLCLATVGLVLPVAAMASLTQAVQALAAVALLLAWLSEGRSAGQRLAWLAAITVLGTTNHVAFLPFSAVVWAAEAFAGDGRWRARVCLAGVAAVATALGVVAWLLTLDPYGAPAMVVRPGIADTAIGIVTGRFDAGLQPLRLGSLRATLVQCAPAPLLATLPLVLLGCLPPDARRRGVPIALASLAVVVFEAGTWLPDPTIGGTPARLGLLVLAGMGLARMAAQAVRGAGALAVVGAVFLGLSGFLGVHAGAAIADAARMQAFVESGVASIGRGAWSTDRLATTRALMYGATVTARAARLPLDVPQLEALPPDRSVMVFVARDTRSPDHQATIITRDLPYPSAASFLSAQGDERWLALALRGPMTGAFCRDLVDAFGQADAADGDGGLALVTSTRRSAEHFVSTTRLDVGYGDSPAHTQEPSPAHFVVDTERTVRIAVNDRTAVEADRGLVLAVFEPLWLGTTAWAAGSCTGVDAPPIDDRRLRAGYLLDGPLPGNVADLPVLGYRPIRIPMGEEGNAWFGEGWHGPEGRGVGAFRWTAAPSASINVLAARQQSIRVRLTATTVVEPSDPRQGLAVSWNGRDIPVGAMAGAERVWTIPAPFVRRGLNTLVVHVASVVSPASVSASTDTRVLGAGVSQVLLEPLDASPR